MYMKTLLVAAISLGAFLPSPAKATPINITFSGTVQFARPELAPDIVAGDSIVGSCAPVDGAIRAACEFADAATPCP
jgi:hypothetical protein